MCNPEQQEKNRKVVNNEVFARVTGMVNYIIQKSIEDTEAPISYEDIGSETDIESLRNEIECNYEYQFKDFLLENYDIDYVNMEGICDDEVIEFAEEIDIIDDFRNDINNVYEWWVVSDWLADKLKEHSEIVIEDGFNSIWGQTTGQAILLDYVITQIQQETKYQEY